MQQKNESRMDFRETFRRWVAALTEEEAAALLKALKKQGTGDAG